MAHRELLEAVAGARPCEREAHGFDHLVVAARRRQHAGEEVGGLERAAPFRTSQQNLAFEREQAQRQFGRRVGMGDRTGDGAAVTDLEVRDVRERQRQQRQFLRQARPPFDAGLRGGGADVQPAGVDAHLGQRGRARDVDQPLRLRQAHVQHRHQRLAAGEDARVAAEFGERGHRHLGTVGALVVECGGLHDFAPKKRPMRNTRTTRCHHVNAAAPVAWRPSDSNSCASTMRAAPSSMRLPTAATLPPTWAA